MKGRTPRGAKSKQKTNIFKILNRIKMPMVAKEWSKLLWVYIGPQVFYFMKF
ncbi:MAG: hypothetical protein UT60_C0050G0003 [candidate division CPR2 bacterium GW2011_GWD2_39_7]|nr:MAG: hypothetical protein UT60_C0050G0003 [candidate division CPR2 bacterium GW2011_GWD2_39_7]